MNEMRRNDDAMKTGAGITKRKIQVGYFFERAVSLLSTSLCHSLVPQIFYRVFTTALFSGNNTCTSIIVSSPPMAKYAHDTIVPFKESDKSKKQQVAAMFDKIAFRYDFLNRFLSAGIDVGWRKKAIKQLKDLQPQSVLDVATGTGDVAILTHKILHPQKITGIDISTGMLEIGKQKIKKLGLENSIELLAGDSETISFPDNSFDAITVAFGVRNFQNLEKGLAEMFRVLKPGGKLAVLEFSRPKHVLFKAVYNLYMNTIAPGFGKLIAKNKDAYQYLNDSVQRFPEGQQFVDILEGTGYRSTYFKPLTLGICTIYCGSK